MTTTRTLATALALLSIGALATACGGDDARRPFATASPTPAPQARVALAEEGGLDVTSGISPAELQGCLEAAGLYVSGPYFDPPPYVEVPTATLDLYGLRKSDSDRSQSATLYVFADPVAAADNAHELIDESADPSTGEYGVHGNVVRRMVSPLDAPPSADEQAVLRCMPTTATPPVEEPSGLVVTDGFRPGKVERCLQDQSLFAERTGVLADDVTVPAEVVTVVMMNDYEYTQEARVYVFADPAAAATGGAELGGADDPHLVTAHNTVTVFKHPPRAEDDEVTRIRGCLPG